MIKRTRCMTSICELMKFVNPKMKTVLLSKFLEVYCSGHDISIGFRSALFRGYPVR